MPALLKGYYSLVFDGVDYASAGETHCGRVIAALKSPALLNESVGSATTTCRCDL